MSELTREQVEAILAQPLPLLEFEVQALCNALLAAWDRIDALEAANHKLLDELVEHRQRASVEATERAMRLAVEAERDRLAAENVRLRRRWEKMAELWLSGTQYWPGVPDEERARLRKTLQCALDRIRKGGDAQ